jgi:hypothetical protein
VIIEQDGCERLAHMPFEMIGEHAQKHVGAHTWADPMEDRTNVEVDGLAERAFDTGQALLGAHRIGGVESIGWNDRGCTDLPRPSMIRLTRFTPCRG